MHSTLLSTSAQSLASQHLKRLETFVRTGTGGGSITTDTKSTTTVKPDSLADAKARLREAEEELSDRMRGLHQAFSEVMRRARPPGRDRRAGSPLPPLRGDRDRKLDRRKRDKVDDPELIVVKKRLDALERDLEDGVSASKMSGWDKGKGKANESTPPLRPPSTTAPLHRPTPAGERAGDEDGEGKEPGQEGKRNRAKALLKDMMDRLEKVEGMRESLETRWWDLEDRVNAREQDELEIERLGQGRWRVIEQLRDPDGVLRRLSKKRRRAEDEKEAKEEVPDAAAMARGELDPSTNPGLVGQSSAAQPGQVKDVEMQGQNGGDEAVQGLKAQVEALKKELEVMKAAQAAREQQITTDITAKLRLELNDMCSLVSRSTPPASPRTLHLHHWAVVPSF